MAKFKVAVEAEEFRGSDDELREKVERFGLKYVSRGMFAYDPDRHYEVETPAGWKRVEYGDWIVTGANGWRHVVGPVTFDAAYEPAA